MNDAVCAGIVIFQPDIARLRQCVDAVLPQVGKLILVDNTPKAAALPDDFYSGAGSKIVRIDNDENLGIAAALNQLLNAAGKEGFKWVLTLDQDSVCGEGLVEALACAVSGHSDIAMASPRIIERGVVWEGDKGTGTLSPAAENNIDFCITSGTLTSIEAVRSVGGFDERLFIDEVDRDICIRLKRSGYRLVRVDSVELQHEFGVELVHRRIFFKVYKYRNYSPFRVYYQVRNLVFMVRKYGADYKPYPAWRLIRPFFTFFVKFIFEPQRLARLSAFVRGYCAGLVMKLEV